MPSTASSSTTVDGTAARPAPSPSTAAEVPPPVFPDESTSPPFVDAGAVSAAAGPAASTGAFHSLPGSAPAAGSPQLPARASFSPNSSPTTPRSILRPTLARSMPTTTAQPPQPSSSSLPSSPRRQDFAAPHIPPVQPLPSSAASSPTTNNVYPPLPVSTSAPSLPPTMRKTPSKASSVRFMDQADPAGTRSGGARSRAHTEGPLVEEKEDEGAFMVAGLSPILQDADLTATSPIADGAPQPTGVGTQASPNRSLSMRSRDPTNASRASKASGGLWRRPSTSATTSRRFNGRTVEAFLAESGSLVHYKTVKKTHHVKILNFADNRWRDMFRFKSSIASVIIIPWVLLTLWGVLVTCLYMLSPTFAFMGTTSGLITVVTVVLSLLLSFRTNTAYDRYWEARKTWSTLSAHCRNLSRNIWVCVDTKGEESENHKKQGAVHLTLAFAKAVKHRLRDQPGVKIKDMAPYLMHVPEFQQNKDIAAKFNIPMLISMHLMDYCRVCRQKEMIEVTHYGAMMTAINGMTECLTAFERIRGTPVPLAYKVHLKQTMLIYLFAMPFQIVTSMGWYSIPTLSFAAFTLLGVQAIGTCIENPFGFDEDDLQLDEFCKEMESEMEASMRGHSAHIEEYSVTRWGEAEDFGSPPLVV
ncbi:Bestrophin, RFP-TM, chloride channel-domain-containing protein [Zopfochytrium polystomum]|nr:Bestrophin, RFP-TM, chloride channel-domain-containing protein [Zopfochytrium polystomum]